MKPNLFHTQFFQLFFLILLAGISIQTYAAKDSQAAPKKRTIRQYAHYRSQCMA